VPWNDPPDDPNQTYTRCVRNEWPDGLGFTEGARTSYAPAPLPRVTFVTAYFDLGRRTADGPGLPRGTCTYLRYFAQWAQLEMNLAIFASAHTLDVMGEMRAGFGHRNRTQLVQINAWDELPFADLLPSFYDAAKASVWRHAASHFATGSVEHLVPEYDLVNHAKVGFLKRAIVDNAFESEFFFWVDTGAGHGQIWFRGPWCPCNWAVPHSITLVGDPKKIAENTEEKYFNDFGRGSFEYHYEDPIGSMWGGSSDKLLAFHDVYERILRHMTRHELMDDDQPVLAMAYHEASDYVRLLMPGGWPYVMAC